MSSRTRWSMVAMCLAATMLVGACGGGGSSDKASDATAEDDKAGDASGDKDSGGGKNVSSDEACEIVTETDATSLFGVAAKKGTDSSPVSSAESVCIWEAEDTANHSYLLQSRVYDGERYYGENLFDGETPISGLGDKAFMYKGPAGVDIQFVQDGKTYTVNYSIINVMADERKNASDQSTELGAIVVRNAG